MCAWIVNALAISGVRRVARWSIDPRARRAISAKSICQLVSLSIFPFNLFIIIIFPAPAAAASSSVERGVNERPLSERPRRRPIRRVTNSAYSCYFGWQRARAWRHRSHARYWCAGDVAGWRTDRVSKRASRTSWVPLPLLPLLLPTALARGRPRLPEWVALGERCTARRVHLPRVPRAPPSAAGRGSPSLAIERRRNSALCWNMRRGSGSCAFLLATEPPAKWLMMTFFVLCFPFDVAFLCISEGAMRIFLGHFPMTWSSKLKALEFFIYWLWWSCLLHLSGVLQENMQCL